MSRARREKKRRRHRPSGRTKRMWKSMLRAGTLVRDRNFVEGVIYVLEPPERFYLGFQYVKRK